MNDKPGFWISFFPLGFLILSLSTAGYLFGSGIAEGPAQILLFSAGAISAGISRLRGISWERIEDTVLDSLRNVLQPILILLLIGALIGIWIRSGIVPALIVWGLELLKPEIFLPSALILSSIVSLATGSSWSTVGTIGVALIGVGAGLGKPLGMVAGAVVSGAYFGDKLSPFSETTNLASSITGVSLLSHIRNMARTTLPAFGICLLAFGLLGWGTNQGQTETATGPVIAALKAEFHISWVLLFPPLLTFFLIYFRISAIPSIFIGVLSGGVCFVLTQSNIYANSLNFQDAASSVFRNLVSAASEGTKVKTGHTIVDGLLSRGGMSSMLSTVWLIISAMFYAGIMEGGGMTQVLAEKVLNWAKARGSLFAATVFTCIGTNLFCADQYLAIVVPGKMFKEAYSRKGLDPRNLSRCLEDSGTMTSALVPWNSCGSFMATALGVPTLVYLPYAFLNLLSPLLSLLTGWTGWGLAGKELESKKELS
ncbi:Na+/H+ antiporter NhaC [Leptospira licerasiae]|uniref:Na+/H+ antiporter NhaC n=1 Tax=Leptospira licerasiae str. MMD4847 TaxID=1049971 RepID=A0ABP2RC20_9LEPT|nr:Na+/H+ antiporter NhaC [Leptospira licerasiae]EID99966.1 Na+/H+ antiporter NhaC [Leptospira licerasiae serovar Varillal str. VAR 010]EJZ42112.1 Na+/H+ antiporter NhaC [Leptospira licerasiae str. MMD4847]